MAALLEGVRVVDLTQALAGPFASMILADLGAEVIKVEPPGERPLEMAGITFKGDSLLFLAINRNKKSIILDLKLQKGKEVFYDLTRKADVVIDNYRPGVIERLNVDYATLKSVNPGIICCSISGFGSTGPYKDRPAYDIVVQAMSGGMSITGHPPPARAGLPIGDCTGGMFAAHAIMAALYSRQRTGVGHRVEVSLLDSQIALLITHVPEYSITGKAKGTEDHPTYRMFKTKDGNIVIAAGGGVRFFPKLCKALGREELTTDPRFGSFSKLIENGKELRSIMQEILLGKSTEEWMERLVKEGVPAGRVNNIEEAITDPQVVHQKMVVPVDVRGDYIMMAGNPIKVSGVEQVYKSPPTFGQHTEETLSQLLGYSKARIAELRKEKVI